MKLHRADGVPAWEKIAPEDRNGYQRVAAKTHGIVTPANAISAGGGALVLKGLWDIQKGHTAKGVAEVVVGRIADLIDGWKSEKDGTIGPTGELIDAGLDKVEMAAALPVLVHEDVLPANVGWSFGAQNVANALCSGIAKKRGIPMHASRLGKNATFGQWGTILLYGAASIAERAGLPSETLYQAADVTRKATEVMGWAATAGYAYTAAFGEPLPLENSVIEQPLLEL